MRKIDLHKIVIRLLTVTEWGTETQLQFVSLRPIQLSVWDISSDEFPKTSIKAQLQFTEDGDDTYFL